jgi:uncharacterized membrane protein
LTLHCNHLLTWHSIAIICSLDVTLQPFAHLALHCNHLLTWRYIGIICPLDVALQSYAHLALYCNDLLTWRYTTINLLTWCYITIICSCGVTLQSFVHLSQINTLTETRYTTAIITINIIISNQWQTLIINKCSSMNHWMHGLSPVAQSLPIW